MYKLKSLFLTIAIFAFASCVSAQKDADKNINKNDKKNDKITACEPDELKTGGEMKTLAEGSYFGFEKPFIFVARSAETYELLKGRIENLPPASEINFKTNAVIAAFGGEQTTGGYSVSIEPDENKFSVKLNKPAPDAITTDALTYPFHIAAVPIEEQDSLMLETSEMWKNSAENYKISGGKFDYSGGLAGRQKSLKPNGTISVWRFENLITFAFDLTATENRNLKSTASGKLSENKAHFARFEAGEFYELPHPPLVADAVFKNDKISLSLESDKRDYAVSDGFSGRGKLEAVKIK